MAVGRRQAMAFVALAIALPAVWAPAARAAAANPAEAFVQENIDRAFVILNNTAVPQEQRYMQFHDLILSLMDARRIGMFTLGPYANRASQAEIESFIAAFSDYTIRFIYGAGFAQTEGNPPKVTGSTQRAPDDVVVSCEVNGPNAQPIKVAFRVRRSADGTPDRDRSAGGRRLAGASATLRFLCLPAAERGTHRGPDGGFAASCPPLVVWVRYCAAPHDAERRYVRFVKLSPPMVGL